MDEKSLRLHNSVQKLALNVMNALSVVIEAGMSEQRIQQIAESYLKGDRFHKDISDLKDGEIRFLIMLEQLSENNHVI